MGASANLKYDPSSYRYHISW